MSITVDNIYKRYGKLQVLDGISVIIKEGEITGFTGRNGCGKTTFLSVLAGVERPNSGQVIFPKGEYSAAYLPQVNPLIEDMTVLDNLKLWADDKYNIDKICARYDLNDIKKRRVSKLSGGMKRRLAIACALINEPQLLIMDEPTAALDILYKSIIHKEMMDYIERGGTIVMVTHEKEEIQMCNSAYFIENGKLRNVN